MPDHNMGTPTGAPDMAAVEAIVHARHGAPFAVLGPQITEAGRAVRAFLPNAQAVEAVSPDGTPLGTLTCVHNAGFWSGLVRDGEYRLRVTWPGQPTRDIADAYALPPLLGEFDLHLLAEGRHQDIARTLGAHPMQVAGITGTRFAVWAPNAQRVSVIGDWNFWDGRVSPMRRRDEAGVWELFVPAVQPGARYKFELTGPHGDTRVKADPMAWSAERAPATASVVVDTAALPIRPPHKLAQDPTQPMSTYEVHAMSWLPLTELQANPGVEGWDVLARRLIPYVSAMGFTHLELMPIAEHPFGGSWGYQPLGMYAPTAVLGSPQAFRRFVDACHDAGVGVILDWVPAHFPTDPHGMAQFDGTALYEHADPREGFHIDWNTLIYNLGRNEVRNFLIGSALHWLETYGIDGLRVDAVASMLYRDYSRQPGQWVPNRFGGRENLESIAFLQDLSRTLAERCPDAVLIAEESTSWPGVTRSADEGGLGFHYKWNMGWMHDTLHYMAEQPIYRRWHHGEITFGFVYVFSEKFVLPLSHDEVVYGKGSLIRKMSGDASGDPWQRFANLRAYLGFMWAYPGKKLMFMGIEFAQDREWNHDAGLDWFLLDDPKHKGMQSLVRDLNGAYRNHPALHAGDCEPAGFQWSVVDDAENSVFAFLRLDPAGVDKPVLVICNFTPVPRYGYHLGVPLAGTWHEIVNTDASVYGGAGIGNAGSVRAEPGSTGEHPASLVLTVPPLATLILRAE